ncbi:hypothetical protein D3C84_1035450 [compost metagenome]
MTAEASWALALAGSASLSFMKLVTTSKIAPCTAREVAMLCAMLGCRPPVFSSARKSLAAV